MRASVQAIAAVLLCACAADTTSTNYPGMTVGSPITNANAGTGMGSGGTAVITGSGGIASGMQLPTKPGTGGASAGSGGARAGSGGMSAALGTGGVRAGSGGMSAALGTGGVGTGGRAAGSGGMSASGSGGAGGACAPNLACKLAVLPSTGDIRQDCVDRINQFRVTCACLPPYERWTDGEACADQMAMYDSTMPGMAHAGAIAKICGNGQIAQDECPGWPANDQIIGACLQGMWDEGPPPTDPCTGACFQAHGHFINMSSTTSKRVACGFATNAQGSIWAVQNFSY